MRGVDCGGVMEIDVGGEMMVWIVGSRARTECRYCERSEVTGIGKHMWLLFWLHVETLPRKDSQTRYPREREPLFCEASIVELFQSFREKELKMSHVCLTDCYKGGTGLPRVVFRGMLVSSKHPNWTYGECAVYSTY